PHRASPWGLLLSAPDWLHVGHLFDMLITFQINREASLGLAHRIARIRLLPNGGQAAPLAACHWHPIAHFLLLYRYYSGMAESLMAESFQNWKKSLDQPLSVRIRTQTDRPVMNPPQDS
ncbi:MAG: hypothetical protein NTW21_07210, partial [Verrucomicrobia bacterium]|nr:hypothetical protein [Verrucomicrobiota bacterium]